MMLTGKQYGYIVQALAETAKRNKFVGDKESHNSHWETLQHVLKIKQLNRFFDHLDDRQTLLILSALEDTADRRQICATTFDAVKMRETAQLIKTARYQEGIA